LIRDIQNRVTDQHIVSIEIIPILDHSVMRIEVMLFLSNIRQCMMLKAVLRTL